MPSGRPALRGPFAVTMTGHFSDPAATAGYVERTRRAVPGLDVLHRLVDHVLAETVPADGRVLVVGAGGGLELLHLAEAHPGWTFDGVDPSVPMLELARATVGPHAGRIALHEGDARTAPDGPYDGATCLLVLHFLDDEERRTTLQAIHRRLRPGAPLLTFHHTGGDPAEFERYARFAAGRGSDPAQVARSATALATQLHTRTPGEEEALLRDAGFGDPRLFYAALTLRGWVARA